MLLPLTWIQMDCHTLALAFLLGDWSSESILVSLVGPQPTRVMPDLQCNTKPSKKRAHTFFLNCIDNIFNISSHFYTYK